VAYSFCRIIGTGILSTPSSVTGSAGSVGVALLLWVLGLFLASAGICLWLELGCIIPRSGGEKFNFQAAYRGPNLFVFTVQAILLVRTSILLSTY
jgi:amino acid transporter